MIVAIAGGHGKVARRLARRLLERGDQVRGLIRNPDHADDLRADGSEPVVCDLEKSTVEEVASAVEGADAVVFAAGAGAGSGAERKWSMDRDGAIKLLEAARLAGVERYLMISSVGAEKPPDDEDVFSIYLRAKAEADRALIASDRAWTIVRPGFLGTIPETSASASSWSRFATGSAGTMSRRCSTRPCTSLAPSAGCSTSSMATAPSKRRWPPF